MVELRPFRPDDLPAFYDISVATGLAGGDASHLYQDRKLMGHLYAAPYAVLAPELTLVAADREGVGGFVVGTHDTAVWEHLLEQVWWPRLRALYAQPAAQPAPDDSPDQRRISMIFHPECTPAHVVEAYPAHLHMNLLPRLQRRGIGSKLLDAWLDVAWTHGVKAVHVGVNRANRGAIQFWSKRSFVEIAAGALETRTLWMGRYR